jgi:hypothetical protein
MSEFGAEAVAKILRKIAGKDGHGIWPSPGPTARVRASIVAAPSQSHRRKHDRRDPIPQRVPVHQEFIVRFPVGHLEFVLGKPGLVMLTTDQSMPMT